MRDLLSETGINQKQLSISASIPPTTISGWLNADRLPDYNALIKLSNFFNVSTDYLLGRTDELGAVVMPSPTAPALSDDERKLLSYYGQMSHPMKIRVIAYCEGMLSTGQNAASKRNA